jgi:SAM-dependent methyltransferase
VWREAAAACEAEGLEFPVVDGIPRFVLPAAAERVDAFLRGYLAVRHAERWTDDDRETLLALPFEDRTGRRAWMWRIRARGLRALKTKLASIYRARRLRVCELGAGVGWLSYRLAVEGHEVVATDVNTDPRDGLGAARHYELPGLSFVRLACEMDRVPLADGSADLVVCAASFHYARDQAAVASEAARLLAPSGTFAVLDSPVYATREAGEGMVAELRERLAREHGLAPGEVAASGYLVRYDLLRLLRDAGLSASIEGHWMGWRWTANYVRARIVGRREPARLPLVVARKGR